MERSFITRFDRKSLSKRQAILFCAMMLVVLTGCSRGAKDFVQLHGKLTYKGGAWVVPGEIVFSPVSVPAGGRMAPAIGIIAADGSYKAQTINDDGIMPGEYKVAIHCHSRTPAPGNNTIPDRFTKPAESGLTLSVPEGSGPIEKDWDIPEK